MSLRDRMRNAGATLETVEKEEPRKIENAPEAEPAARPTRVPQPATAPRASASTGHVAATVKPPAKNHKPTNNYKVVALDDRSNGLKARIHRRMLERINLTNLDAVEPEALRVQIRQIINNLLSEENIPLTEAERITLEQEVLNETFGLGPIEPYLHDPDVSDILVNTHKRVYIERYGQLELTATRFDDDDHLMKIIDRIVSRVGRRIDESSPMVDARLPDGSRVNAIIPPLALDGPVLSIRRFGVRTLDVSDLLELGSISKGMAEVLKGTIKSRLNVLIAGGTGSGKTTLLNALSAYIPHQERIVTIEDAAELQMLQPHVVRLETRPANIEGKGQITQRELVRNALRMRPDRIIVGEVRGDEVLDMLQAMNTGHDGSLTTIHANSARDALHRLETLMLLSGVNLPTQAMREQVSAALDVVVHVTRMADGVRRVVAVSEIVGMEQDVVAMQDIFVFRKTGISEEGKVMGHYEATGIRPKFADRLAVSGVKLPSTYFREKQVV